MDKVNKQELRRLCGDIKNCGGLSKLMTGGLFSKWIDMVSPSSIESLLDEIQEKDRALDLWSQKAQRISDELEQYRKDAERLNLLADHVVIEGFVGVDKDIYDMSCEVAESNGREEPSEDDQRQAIRLLIDAFCAKEGGANG